MSITNIIFILSFALFVAYTVVSLNFLKKKRMALRDTLHDMVSESITEYGDIEPSATTAMALLRKMDAQFHEFNDEAQVIYSNITKCSFLTAMIGTCYALSLIIT